MEVDRGRRGSGEVRVRRDGPESRDRLVIGCRRRAYGGGRRKARVPPQPSEGRLGKVRKMGASHVAEILFG